VGINVLKGVPNSKRYLIMETLSLNSALIVTLTSITASFVLLLSISSGHTVGAKVSDNSDFYTDIDDTL
jgi:hypothetical protein